MRRITTDTPENNTQRALNRFFIKDGETWVRSGGEAPDYPDVTLLAFLRRIIASLKADIDISVSDEDLDEALYERHFDGTETMEGVIAALHEAAWAFSELRANLADYEDSGLSPAEVTAALNDLKAVADCDLCKNALRNGGQCRGGCRGLVGSDYSFEWRGLKEVKKQC